MTDNKLQYDPQKAISTLETDMGLSQKAKFLFAEVRIQAFRITSMQQTIQSQDLDFTRTLEKLQSSIPTKMSASLLTVHLT